MRLFVYLSCIFLLASCHSAKVEDNAKNNHPQIEPIELPQFRKLSDKEQQRYAKACNQFFDTTLAADFNGAFLVAKNGQILFEKYQGFEDVAGQKIPITEKSLFNLASGSKTFTAMATLLLWQQGKLQLTDAMEKYFPGFPYPGITIKTLLNHRSGLGNYPYFMELFGWDATKFCRNEDVLATLMTGKPMLNHPPDKFFAYCNTNYALLALIIEKVSGQTYPDFMRENVFEPIGMSSTFVFTLKDTANAMMSYDWKKRIYPYTFLDAIYGDKNIYSNVQDMLKWDQALYSNQLFKPSTLEAAFTSYSNEKPGIKNYGLGWHIREMDNSKRIIFHNGWWHGFKSGFMHLYQDTATIIAMDNNYSRKAYAGAILANIFSDYFIAPNEEDEDAVVDTVKVKQKVKVAKKK
jgi:CubicO group peptidase (beta-lactamase class C family)